MFKSPKYPQILPFLVSLHLLTVSTHIYATHIKPEWNVGHGTNEEDHVFEGHQTIDGGFIAVGLTRENTGKSTNALVIKTDAKGKLIWQKSLGVQNYPDQARCILETPNGYLIAGTFTQSLRSLPSLIKLDNRGRLLWQKFYSSNRHGAIRGIDIFQNGILCTGYTDYHSPEIPFIADEASGFVMKTDFQGKLIWRSTLPVSQGTKVKTLSNDKEFVVCSTTWESSNNIDHQDVTVMKFDQFGKMFWQKEFDGNGHDQCFDMDITPDGIILGGHTTSYGNGGWDVWLLKVSNNGTQQWHKSFGQPLGGNPKRIYDECYGVKTTPDGGFILACGTGIEPENIKIPTDPLNTWAAYILRTDSRGKLLWQYTYHKPNKGHNAAEYVTFCRDGGFLFFLDSDTLGNMDEENIGFLKLSAEGKGK